MPGRRRVFNTKLGVYTGIAVHELASIALAGSNIYEEDCAPGSQVEFAATAGTTYAIQIGGTSRTSGPFKLRLRPAAPIITDTDPDSPNTATTVKVKGEASTGETVSIYDNADCSGDALGSGSAATFADPGIEITVAAETLTGLHAKGSSEAGDTPCSEGSFVYSTDVTAPAAPTVTRTDPESPSEQRYVSVFGTAEADTIVRLYSDAACTREVSLYDVSAEEFAEYGVPARVQPGRTVTFYAAADDRSGNRSECSTSSVTYTNTAVPPAQPTFTRTDPQSPNTARELRVFGTAPAGTYVRLWLDDECTDPGNYYGGYAEEFEQEGITVEVEEDSVTTFYATAIEPDFDDRRGQEAARVPDDESLCSEDSITYSTDVTAPDVPTGLATTPQSPNAQTTIKVKGMAEEGSTVRLYSSADCTGDPIEGSAATFADPGLDFTVPAGTTKSFSAKAVDPSGNASGCSRLGELHRRGHHASGRAEKSEHDAEQPERADADQGQGPRGGGFDRADLHDDRLHG